MLMGNGELVLNWSHLYLFKGSASGIIGNHSCCSSEWQTEKEKKRNHLSLKLAFMCTGLDDRTVTERAHATELHSCLPSVSLHHRAGRILVKHCVPEWKYAQPASLLPPIHVYFLNAYMFRQRVEKEYLSFRRMLLKKHMKKGIETQRKEEKVKSVCIPLIDYFQLRSENRHKMV